ncbi:substrate-binding domain-containing protein [Nonomuraea antimicrobica]
MRRGRRAPAGHRSAAHRVHGPPVRGLPRQARGAAARLHHRPGAARGDRADRHRGADDRVAAYQTATELLSSPDRPDAIFAASDRAAISAIWAARDLGLSVPGDVAIVGVGNIDEGLISNPQLSTVGPLRHDYTDVVRLLFDRLQAEEPPPAREIVRSWTFVRRGSS